MIRHVIISVSAVFLSCCGVSLHASSPEVPADSLSSGRFDASDYSMMKRWRPENAVPFGNRRFSDNMFVGVTGTGYRPLFREYSGGPYFSLHLGKWFSPYSGVRLSPGVGYYFENDSGYRVKQIGVKGSYLFNMSSYIRGYDPSRFLDVSAVVGLGYAYSWKVGYTGHSVSGHIGLNFDMHVLRNVHLFVEPMVELSVDGLGRQGSELSRRLMPYFNGAVGLSYRFGNDSRNYVPKGNWFIYLSGGTQLQNSDNVLQNMSIKDAFGMQVAFGVGHRYWNCFALRLSAVYSQHNWDITLQGKCLSSQYLAGRLEAMLDLVALIGRTDNNRFALSLMFGPEAGIMLKENVGRLITPFVGMTGGVQVKTKLSDRVAIFVEPRMSMVPYPALSGKASPVNRNYYDGLLNCNVGFEFDL